MIRITTETWNPFMWSERTDYWQDPLPPRERYHDTLAALASFHHVIDSLGDTYANDPHHNVP